MGKWESIKPTEMEMDVGTGTDRASSGTPVLSFMKADCDSSWTV